MSKDLQKISLFLKKYFQESTPEEAKKIQQKIIRWSKVAWVPNPLKKNYNLDQQRTRILMKDKD